MDGLVDHGTIRAMPQFRLLRNFACLLGVGLRRGDFRRHNRTCRGRFRGRRMLTPLVAFQGKFGGPCCCTQRTVEHLRLHSARQR